MSIYLGIGAALILFGIGLTIFIFGYWIGKITDNKWGERFRLLAESLWWIALILIILTFLFDLAIGATTLG